MLNDITPSEALKVLRSRRRCTQKEASALIGISRELLAAIEVGRLLPGPAAAVAIEREFGIPRTSWTRSRGEAMEAVS